MSNKMFPPEKTVPVTEEKNMSITSSYEQVTGMLVQEKETITFGPVDDERTIFSSVDMSLTEIQSSADGETQTSHGLTSPERLRDESVPNKVLADLNAFTPSGYQAEPRRAPAVHNLNELVACTESDSHSHVQERFVSSQDKPYMSSTVLIDQEEEREVVTEDISVIQCRKSVDPRVSAEPVPKHTDINQIGSLSPSQTAPNSKNCIQMSDKQPASPEVSSGLPFEERETVLDAKQALQRFIHSQLARMSPPAPIITTDRDRQARSRHLDQDSDSDRIPVGKPTRFPKQRVVPQHVIHSDKEYYEGKPESEKLFDDFLKDELNGNLKMRNIKPLKKNGPK